MLSNLASISEAKTETLASEITSQKRENPPAASHARVSEVPSLSHRISSAPRSANTYAQASPTPSAAPLMRTLRPRLAAMPLIDRDDPGKPGFPQKTAKK